MRKVFSRFAVSLMMTAYVAGFAACSDDEDKDVNLLVNNGETEIRINRAGGVIDVPVAAEGEWQATVNMGENVRPWAETVNSKGTGQGTLQITVDYLNPKAQLQERTAEVVIKSGASTQTLRLCQYIGLEEGETADNAATEPFADLWMSKGIGSGFNVLTAEQTTDMVLNPRGLIDLTESNPKEYATLFRQTTNPNAKNQIALNDTLEDDSTGLKVKCSIDVKYANFKLNIAVDYNNKGVQVNNVKTYNASQSVVFLSSATDVRSIKALLQEDPTFSKPETRQVVSTGFKWTYMDIMDAHAENDEEWFEDCVISMLDGYGPVVVTGAELGGSLFISMRYDSLYVENNYSVDGKLNADVMLGAVNINADVDVNYSRYGMDIWQRSQNYVAASGGDKAALTALTSLMADQAPNRENIRAAAVKWIDSIVSSNNNDDNTTVVRISYTPIWNLFPARVAKKIKPIVAEYYKGKTICTVNPSELGLLEDNGSVSK